MNAKDCKITLLVTVDSFVYAGVDELVEEIRERIISQLAGHRTPKRLADHVTVTVTNVHTISREVGQ